MNDGLSFDQEENSSFEGSMKVGNIVKWHCDDHDLVSGIVIDTCMIDGLPHATVFWFDLGSKIIIPTWT